MVQENEFLRGNLTLQEIKIFRYLSHWHRQIGIGVLFHGVQSFQVIKSVGV